MIPLRDKIPSSSFPFINIIFIVLNSLIFLYEVSLGGELEHFIHEYGLIPAKVVFYSNTGFVDRFYPFFTSMFLHGGWFHLIGNMLFLYIFGDNVEDRMGHFKYLLFYLICGLGAAFTQIITNVRSEIPMVGASGAISGVLGAYILLFPKSRIVTLVPIFFFLHIVEIPAAVFLLIWFIMQFFSGVATLAASRDTGGVAFWAHVGGFVVGLVLTRFFIKKGYYRTGWSGRYHN
ncbi:MAG TPA: rhomboid family intramembrane serine protease [Thermodesulfobacteriota bacterium]|nr:rhomboid family intramembrane serine protease [Thermodesulfobacteriota bacterium]